MNMYDIMKYIKKERGTFMILAILAAGMGSRYGGLKQIDPVGACGEFITDFSVKDALDAGFDKVVFIIKEEHRKAFDETIGGRIKGIKVEYAYQRLDDIPDGCVIPEGRVKPWGTGHALYAARDLLDDSFAVINADDFYGKRSFAIVSDFLKNAKRGEYCMAGYRLENTVTEHGAVSRGVCTEDENGYLTTITERKKIVKTGTGLAYLDDGEPVELAPDTVVSMNLFGFTPDFAGHLGEGLEAFLKKGFKDPLKDEFYISLPVQDLITEGKASMKVLKTPEKWFGVTYHEDRAAVVEAIAKLTAAGVYKKNLWN